MAERDRYFEGRGDCEEGTGGDGGSCEEGKCLRVLYWECLRVLGEKKIARSRLISACFSCLEGASMTRKVRDVLTPYSKTQTKIEGNELCGR